MLRWQRLQAEPILQRLQRDTSVWLHGGISFQGQAMCRWVGVNYLYCTDGKVNGKIMPIQGQVKARTWKYIPLNLSIQNVKFSMLFSIDVLLGGSRIAMKTIRKLLSTEWSRGTLRIHIVSMT